MKTNAKWIMSGVGVLALAALLFGRATRGVAEPPQAHPEPNYFAFVHSMEGTRPDGDIKLTVDEHLVVDAELGYLFDYYLAGMGEKDLDAIKTEIHRELDRRLKPGPAAEAKRLLANYLNYKGALVDVEHNIPKTTDLAKGARARMNAVQQLRPTYFSAAEIQGLFGASDAFDADTIKRLEVSMDKNLSVTQRDEKLAALDAALPAALREERAAPTKVIKEEESIQKMRAQGASDDEVYRARAAAMSPAAADRFADLDREENAWNSRIASYRLLRTKILGDTARVPPADQQLALQQLRDQQFTPDEQRRLLAFE